MVFAVFDDNPYEKRWGKKLVRGLKTFELQNMILKLHFAQKIIKKYLKFATMAQNEIWTCWEEILEKIKIFEKSISSQIFTVNMTRFHIETITQVVKISTQFFITMKLKIHMQRSKSFLPPPLTSFLPQLFSCEMSSKTAKTKILKIYKWRSLSKKWGKKILRGR